MAPTSRTWRPGAPGQRIKLGDTSPSGVSSVQQAWALREHAGHLGPSLQSCQAPPPGRRPGHQPTWPPGTQVRMGKLQGANSVGACVHWQRLQNLCLKGAPEITQAP